MVFDILFLIGGLALILVGANALTDGSAAVAKRFGISDLVIGLTIVAFGTSAPELVISVLSAIDGSAEMSIGNVVGSNIFNVLMIIGCTALVLPIKVERSIMTNEIPLVILSALVLTFCANDVLLDGASENVVSRSDGLVLLMFFLIFMRYTFAIAKSGADAGGADAAVKQMLGWKSALFVVGGLAGLIFGGQLFVDGASGIARAWGVSESVIGLTLVAGGTSLPELATSITAALKKNPGIAIGNVIGSNLFNLFFCARMQCHDCSAADGKHRQFRHGGACRFIGAVLAGRLVFPQAHDYASGRCTDGGLLCCLYVGADYAAGMRNRMIYK